MKVASPSPITGTCSVHAKIGGRADYTRNLRGPLSDDGSVLVDTARITKGGGQLPHAAFEHFVRATFLWKSQPHPWSLQPSYGKIKQQI